VPQLNHFQIKMMERLKRYGVKKATDNPEFYQLTVPREITFV
jgi:hypothetical protein